MPWCAYKRHCRGKKGTGKKLVEFCCRLAEKFDCEGCRATWAEYGEEPNCSDCLPGLYPENQGVLEVYNAACGQHITTDIYTIMRDVGIKKEDRLYCLRLVQRAWGEVVKVMREKK